MVPNEPASHAFAPGRSRCNALRPQGFRALRLLGFKAWAFEVKGFLAECYNTRVLRVQRLGFRNFWNLDLDGLGTGRYKFLKRLNCLSVCVPPAYMYVCDSIDIVDTDVARACTGTVFVCVSVRSSHSVQLATRYYTFLSAFPP